MIPQLEDMSIRDRMQMLRKLKDDNKKFTKQLKPMIEPEQMSRLSPLAPFMCWRSRDFIVQGFKTQHGAIRLSINRTNFDVITCRWTDGITWDDLQRIKTECGYGDREAVEIYPPDEHIVNIANIRHLWVLDARMPFSWHKDD